MFNTRLEPSKKRGVVLKVNMLKLFCIVILAMFFSCTKKQTEILLVSAKPIQAHKEGNLLVGPSILNDPDRFVWGASVIKGEDQRYHMFYSTWECGDSVPPFSDSWVLRSKIGYAISAYPDRDFKIQKIVLQGKAMEGDSTAWDAQMVHNPHIKKFNDTYYLYYIGSKDPGPQAEGSPGEGLTKRNGVQQNQCIGVVAFKNFDELLQGKYTRTETPILRPRTRVKPDHVVNPSPPGTQVKPDNLIVVNPSVVQRPSDGKYLLYFKGNLYDPHWRGVHGVAIGDSPLGPFTALDDFVFDVRNEDGTIANGEDPYVWYHKGDKRFYAILKDFTGKITEGKPGLALLESLDGIKWTKPENPFFMKKEVVLQTGETLAVHHLERPQLLINDNGTPEVLYAACSLINVGPTQKGESFNVQIPLVPYTWK